jgi:hypothetical protein
MSDVFDFSKVPEEMRIAQARLNDAIKRERKAREQMTIWRKEWDCANASLQAENVVYGEVSLRWDPETQTMKPPKEELHPPT